MHTNSKLFFVYSLYMKSFKTHIKGEAGIFSQNALVASFKVLGLTLRRLMSYIYGAPILDVSRSHTTTQHSR